MTTGFSPLGTEFRVNTYTEGDQERAEVAPLAGGGFVVVWQSMDQDGYGYGVYGQLYGVTGAPVGAEFLVNTDTTGWESDPSVAPLPDGGFVVSWNSDGAVGEEFEILAQLYDTSGARVGGEFHVNTYTPGFQHYPSVALLAGDRFTVVWNSFGQDGSGYGIFGQIYDTDGTPIGDEGQINSYTLGDQMIPRVSAIADGSIVVTWISDGQDGDGWGVYGRIFRPDGTSVPEFQVNTTVAFNQDFKSIAPLEDGSFVVLWASYLQDGSSSGIFGQRFDPDGQKLGGEFQVNTYTPDNQSRPSAAGLPDGGFVVTWESYNQDGSGYGIFGQRFDASGVPVGAEVQINSFTTNWQYWSSVATLENGGFVVTWQSDGQDPIGSYGRGIFAQRFAPELWGTSGNDTLIDRVGANWMNGQAGDDTLLGEDGNDTVFGAGDNDIVAGGDGEDLLDGGTGHDTVIGGRGADILVGGDGNDPLLGDQYDTDFDPVAAQIYRLYRATLDREPDQLGHFDWTERLLAGTSVLVVAAGFINSPEFQAVYGDTTNEDFVTLLYNNVLERDPDSLGLAWWIEQLVTGAKTRAEVVIGFSDSREFIDNTGAEALVFSRAGHQALWSDDVFRLYAAALDRDPDKGGFLSWTEALANGAELTSIANGFLNSPEFQSIYGDTTNGEFVTLVYNNVLDREPDPLGYDWWTGVLDSGAMTRPEVLLGFSQSPEFRADTAADLKIWIRGLGEHDGLDGGAGENILFGGILSDSFVFDHSDAGSHTVSGVEAWDLLELQGFGYVSGADPFSMLTQTGDDVTLVDQGTKIIFTNRQISDFSDDMFVVT